MAVHTAVRGGDTDRPADVTADLERGHPRRESSRASASAAARRAAEIPGVARTPVHGAVGLPVPERHRNVRLPEQAGAGGEHQAGDRPVVRRAIAPQRLDASRLRQSRHLRRLLERHRQPEQRTALSGRPRLVSACSRFQGTLWGTQRNRVEHAVVTVDPREVHLDQLDRTGHPRLERGQHLRGGAERPDLIAHLTTPPLATPTVGAVGRQRRGAMCRAAVRVLVAPRTRPMWRRRVRDRSSPRRTRGSPARRSETSPRPAGAGLRRRRR